MYQVVNYRKFEMAVYTFTLFQAIRTNKRTKHNLHTSISLL